MADRTGLEPATSGVTGRHSNQLNYRSATIWIARAMLRLPNFFSAFLCHATESLHKKSCRLSSSFEIMADRTGLEPATSGVTGRHSNQLNYRSAITDASNCFFEQPSITLEGIGGWRGDRTPDPRLVRAMLSQLSYPPALSVDAYSNDISVTVNVFFQ